MEESVKIRTVAQMLGIHHRTVRRYAESGVIRLVGRPSAVPRSDIEKLARKMCLPVPGGFEGEGAKVQRTKGQLDGVNRQRRVSDEELPAEKMRWEIEKSKAAVAKARLASGELLQLDVVRAETGRLASAIRSLYLDIVDGLTSELVSVGIRQEVALMLEEVMKERLEKYGYGLSQLPFMGVMLESGKISMGHSVEIGLAWADFVRERVRKADKEFGWEKRILSYYEHVKKLEKERTKANGKA